MQQKTVIWLGAAVAAALIIAGNYHFVHGSTVPDGFKIQKKLSFSLNETIINFDELSNMPTFAAKARYPQYLAGVEKTLIDSGVERLTSANVSGLRRGMSRTDAMDRIGPPDNRETIGQSMELWTWNSKVPGRSVSVMFENGRAENVTTFGF